MKLAVVVDARYTLPSAFIYKAFQVAIVSQAVND